MTLIVELTAVVLTLADNARGIASWLDLARSSLFLLWTGLGCAAALCLLRAPLEKLQLPLACAAGLLAILGVVLLVSLGALYVARFFPARGGNLGADSNATLFVLRNLCIGAIVGALALRYFYVSSEWRRNVVMQARARIHALQARIRPHFLFNSMNTIAALTRSDPAKAEEAVQDLADLFRANLNEQRAVISLAEELEVAQIYERIEALRLGSRLHVDWRIDGLPLDIQVPSLMVQPLLENAIYHGIEPQHEGGTVRVDALLENDTVYMTVRNPLPPLSEPGRSGHQMALANIRERLELMYPDRASVSAGREHDEYVVRLCFPRSRPAGAP
ncbi:MAG: sensor histidine kinase [Steroidobacteraceae bacterium]